MTSSQSSAPTEVPRQTAARPSGVLVLAYGNPGRMDDGLGPAVATALASRPAAGITVTTGYQLMPEDAAEIAKHGLVLFVDAAVSGPAPFWVKRIAPSRSASFSTHAVAPAALLALAGDALGGTAEAFALGIRGYQFDGFGEGLSPQARDNLNAALAFLEEVLVLERKAAMGRLFDAAAAPARRARGKGTGT